jgi:LacI family transcriptional regulator
MAGIRDVARIAGVSPSTVSRVMNGTANVDDEKRRRVLAAIKETGFKPNELARALFKKSSKIIGVIVPDIENPFFNEFAKAVEEEAYGSGYRILLCNSNNDAEKEVTYIETLDQMNADGLIMATQNDSMTNELKVGMPIVAIDRKMTNGAEIACIESNHYKGGRLAAECLIKAGCKKIINVRGPQILTSAQMRFKGYQDVCEEYGIRQYVLDSSYSYESGFEVGKKILETYPDADGIIASNDMVAISIYKVLHHAGKKAPKNFQIIGFDDIRFSRLMTPELTSIRQPITEMGKLAAQIISRYHQHQDFQRENIFDVSLVERKTTKKFKTGK